MDPLADLQLTLKACGLSRHEAGPGLEAFLTSQLRRNDSRGIFVLNGLEGMLLVPEFPVPPAAAEQCLAHITLADTVAYFGDPAMMTRVTVIVNDLLSRGVVLAVAALAVLTADRSHAELHDSALWLLQRISQHRFACPRAHGEPSLAAELSVEPLIAACLRLGVARVSVVWLEWFAGLVLTLHAISKRDAAEGLHVPPQRFADLVNLLLNALVDRGTDSVNPVNRGANEQVYILFT